MDKIEFFEKMDVSASKMEISLTKVQLEQLYIYMQLLIEWNENINLTTIVEPEEIILKHFIDSFTISKHIETGCKLIDVGTGAGFPGIALKILRADLEIVLLDSLNKRIKFLDEVIKSCGLTNIETIHGRIEEIAHHVEHREQYDIVTSRAVANLSVLSEYTIPFCKIGGKSISMKGVSVSSELEEAAVAIDVLGGKVNKVEEFNLLDTQNMRSIVIIEKVKYTLKYYPRKAGTPSKEPIIKK